MTPWTEIPRGPLDPEDVARVAAASACLSTGASLGRLLRHDTDPKEPA